MKKMVIQIICPDQKGIIAKLTSILYDLTINILSIEQHVDKEEDKFYIRLFIDLSDIKISTDNLKNKIQKLNNEIQGQIRFKDPNHKINVYILKTKIIYGARRRYLSAPSFSNFFTNVLLSRKNTQAPTLC